MQELYLISTLGSLIGLISADQDFYESLTDAMETTKKTINQEQLDDIHGIGRELEQVANSRFDELLPEAESPQYGTSIDKYLASRKQFVDRQTLDKSLRKSCKTLNGIWAPVIMDYYLKKELNLLKLSDVKNHDSEGYEMLLDAGFCHNAFNVPS